VKTQSDALSKFAINGDVNLICAGQEHQQSSASAKNDSPNFGLLTENSKSTTFEIKAVFPLQGLQPKHHYSPLCFKFFDTHLHLQTPASGLVTQNSKPGACSF
jgi:hypothetical protein